MCIWCCGDVVSSCVFPIARTRLFLSLYSCYLFSFRSSSSVITCCFCSCSLWAIDNFTRAVSLAEISHLLSFNFIQIPIFAFIGFLIVIFRVALYGASAHTIDLSLRREVLFFPSVPPCGIVECRFLPVAWGVSDRFGPVSVISCFPRNFLILISPVRSVLSSLSPSFFQHGFLRSSLLRDLVFTASNKIPIPRSVSLQLPYDYS